MALERLKPEDESEAAELLAEYWRERGAPQYDKKWAEDYLKQGHKKEINNDEFFIYMKGGERIGTVSLITDVSGTAEIRDLVVWPRHRGKGNGREILESIIEISRKRGIRKLHALTFQEYKKFYTSTGFEEEGLLRSHFVDGEDLSIMSRFL